MSKEELAVQVTEINGIEVDNVDFTEASENEVFQ